MTARAAANEPFLRTFDTDHRQTRIVGDWERRWMRQMDWTEGRDILQGAKAYDRLHKKKGDALGPFGPRALFVLDYLIRLACNCKGQVWPTLDQIGLEVGYSRRTVVDCLKRLSSKRFGPLRWIRRLVFAEGEGARGRKVEQTSNLYRIEMPASLQRLVRKRPAPVDEEQRKSELVAQLRAMDQAVSPLNDVFRRAARNRAETDAKRGGQAAAPKP